MDTTFVNNLNESMKNVRSGTKNFDEDMEALKHNILLRNYGSGSKVGDKVLSK
jgi:hypothetical protein